ncbi:HAAS signaling domain-containing protein [Trinickia fusca]|uniref:DUF1700 domain-containing protein n=1 Tax=Trinickia fusca TaxID=2419777 RepID=A0A494XED0_9BURK|nr:DUF1700 domain-containing protein [Trinickia fusca]RKP45953.1 DUF1700 domain-containing protein [Trinickia fusca]
MKQDAFIQQLRQELDSLPKAEVDEIIADYREYIGDALAAGRSEQEVITALGDPVKLARELKAQASYRKWQQSRSFENLAHVIVSIAGLGLLNAMLLVPFMIYLSLLTACYAASIAFAIGGLIAAVGIGSHHLFGWPSFNAVPVVVMSHGHDHAEAADGASDDANDGLAANIKDIKIEKDVFVLTPKEGNDLSINTNAGGIEISRKNGKLEIVAANEGARALLIKGADGTVSIRRADATALELKSVDGSHMTLARSGKDGKSSIWEVSSGDGDHVRLEQDEKGKPKSLAIESGSDAIVIDGDHAALVGGKDRINISASSSMGGITFGSAVGMFAGGVIGLLLCIWLTRKTWRALVRYVHRQIDKISARLDSPGQAAR